MSADLLTRKEREVVDMLVSNYDGIRDVTLSHREVDLLVDVLARLAPEPQPKPLEQVLYEAENLSEKPWGEMTGDERSQYVRMADAAIAALEARS